MDIINPPHDGFGGRRWLFSFHSYIVLSLMTLGMQILLSVYSSANDTSLIAVLM